MLGSVSAAAEVEDPARLVLVVDDVGLSRQAFAELKTMKPLTLSFLPYADNLPMQTSTLAELGHELMVHLPMQPRNFLADPGPNALLPSLSAAERGKRIAWNLNRFKGYIAVNNHMGSLASEDPAIMIDLMVALKERGLFFLDSLTSPKSLGRRAARATGVPFLARDIFLDNVREPEAILAQLEQARHLATANGLAIAIGHPYEVTLQTIKKWRQKHEGVDLRIVALREAFERGRPMTARSTIPAR